MSGIGQSIHPVSVAGGRLAINGNVDNRELLFCLDASTSEKLWVTALGFHPEECPALRWLTQRVPAVDFGDADVITVFL